MTTKLYIVGMFFFVAGLFSCNKFLDEKPDQKLDVPSDLTALQSILDYYLRIGTYEPSCIEIVADDYYLSDASWKALSQEYNRRMYLWEGSNVFPANNNDWSYCYNAIYAANTVLEAIDKVEVSTEQENLERDNIKGQALAIRGRMFMKLAFIWSPVYRTDNLDSPYGIPLKLETNFNDNVSRATLGRTYAQIEKDYVEAAALLRETQVHQLRTSKAGVFGLLSRLYLVMGDYEKTYRYADSCLRLKSDLLDYNTLSAAATFPIKAYNEEVILGTQMLTPAMLAYTNAIIDPDLYNAYEEGDLRKKCYFKKTNDNTMRYYGSYTGSYQLFDGIATDEVLLNRAEAAVRLGQVSAGTADLNSLLVKRWEDGTYSPYQSASQQEMLSVILQERRKSLLMRGVRWTDLKRLNRDGANIWVSRIIEGVSYTLEPNDPRYALPIPDEVITTSGIAQNPR